MGCSNGKSFDAPAAKRKPVEVPTPNGKPVDAWTPTTMFGPIADDEAPTPPSTATQEAILPSAVASTSTQEARSRSKTMQALQSASEYIPAQEELLDSFLPCLEHNGSLYRKVSSDFCRLAMVGETLSVVLNGQLISSFVTTDNETWEVRADIFSCETYTKTDKQIQCEYKSGGAEILGDSPHLLRLRDMGFRRYSSNKEVLAMQCPTSMLSHIPNGLYRTANGGVSEIPQDGNIMAVVDVPGKQRLHLLPKYLLQEKYRAMNQVVKKDELASIFAPILLAQGSLYRRAVPDYARRARMGETVTTIIDGVIKATEKATNETSWVIRPATFSGELYMLSETAFRQSHTSKGEEIKVTCPGLQHLVDIGFQSYENNRVICAAKLTDAEVEQYVPGGIYESSGSDGAAKRIMPGSWVASTHDGAPYKLVNFISDHLLLEKYALIPKVNYFTQEQVVSTLRTAFEQHGILMSNHTAEFLRPAKQGETVTSSFHGEVRAVYNVADTTSWVGIADTASRETYVITQAMFHDRYKGNGVDIASDSEYFGYLRKAGFKKYVSEHNVVALQVTKETLGADLTYGRIWLDEACTVSCRLFIGDFLTVDVDMAAKNLRIFSAATVQDHFTPTKLDETVEAREKAEAEARAKAAAEAQALDHAEDPDINEPLPAAGGAPSGGGDADAAESEADTVKSLRAEAPWLQPVQAQDKAAVMMTKPPPSMSKEEANALQEKVRILTYPHCSGELKDYYPDVVLSYATGRRTDDGEGAGPGLHYTATLMQQLFQDGIASYSGLTLPIGSQWEVFKLRLGFRGKPKAKVLIVILTPDFFNSLACLQEVSLAEELNVPVVPVRFEEGLPKKAHQWPNATSEKHMLMVERAQAALGGNTIPARGTFVENAGIAYKELHTQVRSLTEAIAD